MGIYTKTSLDSIKRSPFQALAAISVLSLAFLIGTLLVILVYSSNQVLYYFETRPQVLAFLVDEATPEQVLALQSELASDTRIKDVLYVSKEGALAVYKKVTVDNPLLSELVSPSIFPASIEFSLSDLSYAEEVFSQLQDEEIVESVGFTASLGGEDSAGQVIERLRNVSFYIRAGGVILTSVLVGISFLVLLVIISIRMSRRRDEVEILKLIGAKSGFIRIPIVLEALIYATVGVFVGWIVVFVTFLYATPTIFSYFGEINVLPSQTSEFVILFLVILGIELTIGIFLALMGSLLAISRARNLRRR